MWDIVFDVRPTGGISFLSLPIMVSSRSCGLFDANLTTLGVISWGTCFLYICPEIIVQTSAGNIIGFSLLLTRMPRAPGYFIWYECASRKCLCAYTVNLHVKRSEMGYTSTVVILPFFSNVNLPAFGTRPQIFFLRLRSLGRPPAGVTWTNRFFKKVLSFLKLGWSSGIARSATSRRPRTLRATSSSGPLACLPANALG